MRPKIVSLGYAVPEYFYSQREIFDALAYPHRFWRIFHDSQIAKRHFCIPLEWIRKLSFQEQQEEYAKSAAKLAKMALLNALDGRDPKSLGLITYSTCTGFPPGPTIGHYLAHELGLENTRIENLSSQGCEGAFPGLCTCYDFTAIHRRPAAAIACELCSLTYYPEPDGKPDPENGFELLRGNALFGDGCSCAIIGLDDEDRHPEICDFNSRLDTRYIDYLGYVWRNGRLRLRLAREVPNIATELIYQAITGLLSRNWPDVNDISYWVIHPPGMLVLDNVRDRLAIPEEKLKYSKQALQTYGNVSSATVGIVSKLLMEEEKHPEGYLLMANVGPGMVANAALLRFGDEE